MAGVGKLSIELGYPAKELSPNSRCHFMQLHRAKKAYKHEAYWATKIEKPRDWKHDGGRLSLSIKFHPVAGKCEPDPDNAIASLKSAIDGIAEALGVNDRLFDPSFAFGEPVTGGKVIVEIGGANV